jgi:hypothetical protein
LAQQILAADSPMTVRQVYYRLVSDQVLPNSIKSYVKVSQALVTARKEGLIPWEWIEDRTRRPRHVPMWSGLAEFAEQVARRYRGNVWAEQPRRIECWLEKDALSGIFGEVLEPYGITLNVARGYDGWSSIYEASQRLGGPFFDTDTTATDIVLYFGDFDPSGEDMVESLRRRLEQLECQPEIIKVALTREDIDTYSLPPNPTKVGDRRSAAFVERYGDLSVELDALPPDVLRQRIIDEVESRIDLPRLNARLERDQAERERLRAALRTLEK